MSIPFQWKIRCYFVLLLLLMCNFVDFFTIIEAIIIVYVLLHHNVCKRNRNKDKRQKPAATVTATTATRTNNITNYSGSQKQAEAQILLFVKIDPNFESYVALLTAGEWIFYCYKVTLGDTHMFFFFYFFLEIYVNEMKYLYRRVQTKLISSGLIN